LRASPCSWQASAAMKGTTPSPIRSLLDPHLEDPAQALGVVRLEEHLPTLEDLGQHVELPLPAELLVVEELGVEHDVARLGPLDLRPDPLSNVGLHWKTTLQRKSGEHFDIELRHHRAWVTRRGRPEGCWPAGESRLPVETVLFFFSSPSLPHLYHHHPGTTHIEHVRTGNYERAPNTRKRGGTRDRSWRPDRVPVERYSHWGQRLEGRILQSANHVIQLDLHMAWSPGPEFAGSSGNRAGFDEADLIHSRGGKVHLTAVAPCAWRAARMRPARPRAVEGRAPARPHRDAQNQKAWGTVPLHNAAAHSDLNASRAGATSETRTPTPCQPSLPRLELMGIPHGSSRSPFAPPVGRRKPGRSSDRGRFDPSRGGLLTTPPLRARSPEPRNPSGGGRTSA